MENCIEMQEDLQLNLNVDKCNVLRIHRKKDPLSFSYTIAEQQLEAVNSIKYLGVVIRKDLKWNDHIKSIVGKADGRLRFIGRILRKCNPKTKEVGYSTLLRPQLEYGSPVWDPYRVGLIEEVEKIQRRAARFVTGSFGNRESVTEMIDNLQWKTLQERRSVARYGLLSKFREHTFTEDSSSILLPPTYISRRDRERD